MPTPPHDPAPPDRLAAFRGALEDTRPVPGIVDEFLLHGDCYAVTTEQHWSLKARVATEFALEGNQEVFVVGSTRLGFSIAPQKRYVIFGDHSDVDVAIVSRSLFEEFWHLVDEYRRSGAYWPDRAAFEGYLASGWIRPDKFPNDGFPRKQQWFDFFYSLQAEQVCGPYKIAAGIYYDMEFLRRYQSDAVEKCRSALVDDESGVG